MRKLRCAWYSLHLLAGLSSTRRFATVLLDLEWQVDLLRKPAVVPLSVFADQHLLLRAER
jgi:fumarate reductase subunit C